LCGVNWFTIDGLPFDMQNTTPPPPPEFPVPPKKPPLTDKKTHLLLYGCGGLVGLLVLIVATVTITIWWIQRPIRPVVLSAGEKAVIDQKLQRLEGGNTAAPLAGDKSLGAGSNRAQRGPASPVDGPSPGAEVDDRNLRVYVPGSKTLKLTEREINGLLNANTDLGKSVRLEFAQDAINAYVAVRIPDDFPVGGGRMFRGRARFRLSLGDGGQPYAILEDVTVFGLSLPKAWLGGIKGENLIGEAVGQRNQLLKGIKSLHVEPGALVLEVQD